MLQLTILVNGLVSRCVDVLLWPLLSLGPFWSLSAFSVLCGLFMGLVFSRLGSRGKLRKVKKRLHGELIASRLFQRSPGVFLRLQGRILLDSLACMRYLLLPAAVTAVPFFLILVQLHGRYGLRPLDAGEAAVVTVTLGKERPAGDLAFLALAGDGGAVVETPPVRVPGRREASWRVRATREGQHRLTVTGQGIHATGTFSAGRRGTLVSEVQASRSVRDLLLNPSGSPVQGGSSLQALTVDYPRAAPELLGREIGWLPVFLVLSVASGLVLTGRRS